MLNSKRSSVESSRATSHSTSRESEGNLLAAHHSPLRVSTNLSFCELIPSVTEAPQSGVA